MNRPLNRRLVWLLLAGCSLFAPGLLSAQIDLQAIQARGLQVTRSPHLTLITDVRDRQDVAEFNDVFEAAVQQWCRYFQVPEDAVKDWHLIGCIIRDPNQTQVFTDAGLFPDDLPSFPAGYQLGSNFWVFLQDGDYYTRHLLIHEGTHAFMEKFLGGYGAPWYSEGMAELLGLHRWQDQQLSMNHQVESSDEVPFWGRVKLIRKAHAVEQGKTLNEVLEMENKSFREVDAYAWAWALCQFLDRHPEYQKQFRKLPAIASLPPAQFNQKFREAWGEDWPAAAQQWLNLVTEMEYGYDVVAATPTPLSGTSTAQGATRFEVAVNRGWQETGILVEPGDRIRITAEGLYRVKQDTQAWPCDAGGITIEYYAGRPLGRLIAAIRTPKNDFLKIIDVGLSQEIICDTGGQLLLRINESPAAWADNQGQLKVTVEALSD